ncbi:MAG: energy-coupled thiamine transporter ThiT [Lachnospiraceae bacterium]|nr:energy-coupled thiamine transporter ThiT [Lachnospiraceae bacterium]
MLDFLMSAGDGYYELTPAGTTVFSLLAVVIVLLIAAFHGKKDRFDTRKLAFAAAAIALGYTASYIRLFRMPWGGSVTLLSMFFITLIGYWYGPSVGFTGAFAYGLLQFVQGGGSYMLSPLQVMLDYIFAFTALGASGFFKGKKNGLVTGYLVAILLRGLFHAIGGYLYWMDYMPDNFPAALAGVYPFCYNYAYILVEGLITLAVLAVPAVKKAVTQVTAMAREDTISPPRTV